MRKASQRGYSAVETILVLVIVGLIAFVVWYVFSSRSDTETTLGNAATTQTEVPKQTAKKTTTQQSAPVSQVLIKTDSKLGQYLSDPNNKALYTYGSDTSGVSNCSGACLAAWPIYTATTTTDLAANVTVIKRADGTSQYAYKGMPLYYYSSDTAGTVTGDGVGGFHVAKP